jgi:TrmH family RNA methyltransferase
LKKRKFRATTGEFLAEGAPTVREALAAGAVVRVLASADACASYPDLTAEADELSEEQVAQLSDTVAPQGIFAICRTPQADLGQVLAKDSSLVVICSQIRDPGNLGTVIRCADAFGADGVILTTGSVDWTNPKTVRASVGSVFHLPIVSSVTCADAVTQAKEAGFTVVASDVSGTEITEVVGQGSFDSQVAWIMGNEAWGLPQEKDLADVVVRIPMWGQAESLNLSVAAGICLFISAMRQRLLNAEDINDEY